MSAHITGAIEELEKKLQEQLNEVAETKKAINVLCRQLGQQPRYADVTPESAKGGKALRRDQFYRKPLATAVREYLELRGSAATLDEIFDALKQGGFEFVGRDDSIKKRGLQISMRKNRKLFARLKGTNTYGLWEFYGGRPRKDIAEEEEEAENDKAEEAEAEERAVEKEEAKTSKKQTA